MEHVIYALKCPRTLRVRYIGYTRCGIEKRLVSHVCEARRGALFPRCDWIRKLLAAGTLPIIEIIEIVTVENWRERERYWIAEFGGMDALLNCTTGGDGGSIYSLSTREKMSRAKLGKPQQKRSPAWRAKIAASVAGHHRKHTQDAKDRIAATLRARFKANPRPRVRAKC